MIKKLSFGLLRRQRNEDRPPRPSSPLDFSDGPITDFYERDPFYRDPSDSLRLEALALEPLVAPTLRAMAPTVRSRQDIMATASQGRRPSLAEDAQDLFDAHTPENVRRATVDHGLAMYRQGALRAPDGSVSAEERSNPFDDITLSELPITPIPKRVGHRKTASTHGRRDMPLRVVAIRRAHQAAFARAIEERMAEEAVEFSQSRRVSPEDLEPSRLWAQRSARWGAHVEPPQLDLFTRQNADGTAAEYTMQAVDEGYRPMAHRSQVPPEVTDTPEDELLDDVPIYWQGRRLQS